MSDELSRIAAVLRHYDLVRIAQGVRVHQHYGPTDRQTDRCTDRQTDRGTDGRTYSYIEMRYPQLKMQFKLAEPKLTLILNCVVSFLI